MLDNLFTQLGPVFYLAIIIIGFFISRTLKQIDANQTKLWTCMDVHEKRLSMLEGAHNTVMRQGGHKE